MLKRNCFYCHETSDLYLESANNDKNKKFNFASSELYTENSELKPNLFYCKNCEIIFSELCDKNFEKNYAPKILENYKPSGDFRRAPGQKIKTDMIEDKGGEPRNNNHYSVKWKRDNDFGYKTHQTSAEDKIWNGEMKHNDGHYKGQIEAIDIAKGEVRLKKGMKISYFFYINYFN